MKDAIKKMIVMLGVVTLMASCQTNTGTGAIVGTAVGAGAGQMIGGNSKSTAIGAGAGAILGTFVGYISDTVSFKSDEKPDVQSHENEGEFVEVERKKVITVKEKVPVNSETRKYYIDPKTKRKIYIK